MMSNWKFGAAATAACAACCAPLLAPLFAGSVFTGLGTAYFGSAELGALVIAAGLAILWYVHRLRKPAAKACGCKTGNACDVPQSQ